MIPEGNAGSGESDLSSPYIDCIEEGTSPLGNWDPRMVSLFPLCALRVVER